MTTDQKCCGTNLPVQQKDASQSGIVGDDYIQNEEQWDDLPEVPEHLQNALGEMGARLLGKENHTYLGLIGENKGEVEIGLSQYDKNPPWSDPINPIWGVIYATQGTAV